MFVYILVTSIVQRRMFCSSFLFSIVLIKCVVSLMYEGRRTTACFIQWSKNLNKDQTLDLITEKNLNERQKRALKGTYDQLLKSASEEAQKVKRERRDHQD